MNNTEQLMAILEEAYVSINRYSNVSRKLTPANFRAGLMDLWVYDTLIDMCAMDGDIGSEWTWNTTPDLVMAEIINTRKMFDLENGYTDCDEQIREYLKQNKFITYIDELPTTEGE